MMGTDGSWVRTYNETSAKLFLAERELELARLEEHRQRSRELRRRAWRKVMMFLSARGHLA